MRKLTIICLLILFAAAADEAQACLCGSLLNPTPEKIQAERLKEFASATMVFTGEVVMLDEYTVRFKVNKIWKGPLTDEITMLTGRKDYSDGTYSFSSCDFRYRREKYLMYAFGPLTELKTYVCSRSNLINHAAEEEKGLDEITPHHMITQDKSPVNVGEVAPDFTLEDQKGGKVTLSDSRSKSAVVLVFYRGYW